MPPGCVMGASRLVNPGVNRAPKHDAAVTPPDPPPHGSGGVMALGCAMGPSWPITPGAQPQVYSPLCIALCAFTIIKVRNPRCIAPGNPRCATPGV
jgi:hypothetical protein